MADTGSTNLTIHLTLPLAIGICLALFCTTCGCLSIPSWQDEEAYQPTTFGPTGRPTHIPSPSPTMVCDPTDNQTSVVSVITPPV